MNESVTKNDVPWLLYRVVDSDFTYFTEYFHSPFILLGKNCRSAMWRSLLRGSPFAGAVVDTGIRAAKIVIRSKCTERELAELLKQIGVPRSRVSRIAATSWLQRSDIGTLRRNYEALVNNLGPEGALAVVEQNLSVLTSPPGRSLRQPDVGIGRSNSCPLGGGHLPSKVRKEELVGKRGPSL